MWEICRSFREKSVLHLSSKLDDAKLLVPHHPQNAQKWMQSRKYNKKYNSTHYAHNVFFRGAFSQTSSTLLKNGHL